MRPEHIVSIILVGVAVVVVALFLIAIVVELRRTHLQLVTILGAVGETVDKTDGLEAIVADISADLAAGEAAFADCVDRLERRLRAGAPVREPQQRRPAAPAAAPAAAPEADEVSPLKRPGDVFQAF
jgi:hypothetical protein